MYYIIQGKNMKKIFKLTLLLTLLSNLLMAEILFDLNEQHFSNSLDGDGVLTKYSLPNVYVTTELRYSNSNAKYYPLSLGSTGGYRDSSFDIEFKSPMDNMRMSFDISFSLHNKVHTIQFIDTNGKVVTLGLRKAGNGFNFDGQKENLSLANDERIIATIKKTNNEFYININNSQLVKTYTVTGFSKLKFIKIDILGDIGPSVLSSLIKSFILLL